MKHQPSRFLSTSRAAAFLAAVLLAATCPAIAQESEIAPPPAEPGLPKTPAPPTPAKPAGSPRARQVEAAAHAQERTARDVSRTFELAYGDKFDISIPRAGAPVLVIPKDAGQAGKGAMEADQEDWQIMERILEKAVNQRDEGKQAMGIAVRMPFKGFGEPRNVYLEGYGALFFLDVGFPLMPPATVKEDSQPKDTTKAEWEEAKRELNHPAEPFVFNWSESGGLRPPREEYSADRVEELKKNMLIALKNAAHIKALKSDETVTVIVTGATPAGKVKTKNKPGTDANPNPPSQRENDEKRVARLLVRAKKSDAESFLKDKLSLEDFRRKATVFVY